MSNVNLSSFQRAPFEHPDIPTVRISSSGQPAMHRFFDSSPVSPSGRYLAYTAFENDTALPKPGDLAHVVVVDLHTGGERYRSSTAAWDTQLGAQVQWGATDDDLLFNRMDAAGQRAHGVVVNPLTGHERALQGQVYAVSPDGERAASCKLETLGHVQPGYGVIVAPKDAPMNRGARDDDGVWITDIACGTEHLILSYQKLIAALPAVAENLNLNQGGLYGFHVKWSPDGSRIMLLLRWLQDNAKSTRNFLLSFTPDGEDVRLAVHARDWGNGHHPNWCPNSSSIIMNVSVKNEALRFPLLDRAMAKALRSVGIRRATRAYDLRLGIFGLEGENRQIVAPQAWGSGHPTLHVSERFVLTDAYPTERVSRGDGTAPIRTFGLQTHREEKIMDVPATPRWKGPRNEWRVDAHPAWDRSGRWLVLNAAPDGDRGVYLADFSKYLNSYR